MYMWMSHLPASYEILSKVKLRAEILIEVDADDFVVAADHQRRIEGILKEVRENYPQASLTLRERKERSAARRIRPEQPVQDRSGRIHEYTE